MSQGKAPKRAKAPVRSKGGPRSETAGRNVLIEQYHGYVQTIVSRLIRTMGLPAALRDDFISAGMLGLVEAADRFDPARGYEFKSFAFLRIRGAVIDHIRSGCELSGHGYRVFKALEAAHELQAERLERPQPPTAGVPGDRTAHALEYLSKSATAFKMSRLNAGAVPVEEATSEDPEETLAKKQEIEKIRTLVATLPEKERTIIEQYYFHDRKFTEVAENYAGLSKSWVSRLHDRALTILRDKFLEEAAQAAS